MQRGLLDALYWRLHTAYLKNDRQTATKFLEMIEDEEPLGIGSLAAEIGPIHHSRFLKIREGVHGKSFSRLSGTGTATPMESIVPDDESTMEEKEFHKLLLGNMDVLAWTMGIDDPIVAYEVDLNPYGRCDFILRAGRTIGVVEIKMSEAKSSVVGQIGKYQTALELDMCLGTHDEVRTAVVAGGFSKYVAEELSRSSVMMIEHHGDPISLRRLA